MTRAAVAALALLVVLGAAASTARRDFDPRSALVFELTGKSKLYSVGELPVFGVPADVSAVDATGVLGCLAAAACDGGDGAPPFGAYLAWRTPGLWELRATPAGPPLVTLTGVVDGKGRFLMTGASADDAAQFVLQGKAKLAQGTLDPVKVRGRLSAVNAATGRYALGAFRTVGEPTLFSD